MNCKPGDLAVVIRNTTFSKCPPLIGKFVHILYAVPSGEFVMPDGRLHCSADKSDWLVEFDRPIRAPIGFADEVTGVRDTCYAAVPDRVLRPIRPHGDDEQDESHRYLPPVPKPEILALPVREMTQP